MVNDPSYRAHVSQYEVLQPKFRLIDLPVELRLRIAEYALAQDEPLRWYWSTYQSDKKVGSFQGIEELTALSRVSQQLYSETANIVWKVNTVAFQYTCLGDAFHAAFWSLPSFMRTIRKETLDVSMSYRFFLSKVPDIIRKNLKTAIFCILLPPITDDIAFHLHFLSGLAKLTPYMRIVIQATNWSVHQATLVGSKHTITTSYAHVDDFWRTGLDLELFMHSFAPKGDPRNWLLYPTCHGDLSVLKGYLKEDLLHRALGWHAHGI
jgi:hypothetical protein